MAEVQNPEGGPVAYLGRDGSAEIVVAEIEICEGGQAAYFDRDRPAEVVVAEVQNLEGGQVVYLGRDRPAEVVVAEIEICEADQAAYLGRDGSAEVVVVEMQYGHPPVSVGRHAMPRVEGGGGIPVRVRRPPRPVRGPVQGLQRGPVLRLIVLDQGDGGRGDGHAGGTAPDDDGLDVPFRYAVRRATNKQCSRAAGRLGGNDDSRQGVVGGVIGAPARRAGQSQGNCGFLCPSGTQLGGDGYRTGEVVAHKERVYREGDGLGLTQGRPQVQRQTDARAKEERDKPEAFKGKREGGHFSLSVDDNSPRIMSRHCRRVHTGYLASNILTVSIPAQAT